jgi:pimeloyl-ACP methyl ester carboxylesterase
VYVSEIRYAKSDGVNIAYEIRGDGPFDLVYVPGWVSHLEEARASEDAAGGFNRLASFSRLIRFDKRGTGMSDRVSGPATLEDRMDDVRAVMEAAGSTRAAVYGISEGGPMSMLFAATYPDRTRALILYGSYPRRLAAPDYPWGPDAVSWQKYAEDLERHWGTDAFDIELRWPSHADDPQARAWWVETRRRSMSPGAARALAEMNAKIDVRHVLASIRVPTLILNCTGDRVSSIEGARYMANRIPGAKLVELPGEDHVPSSDVFERILAEVQVFLTGARPLPVVDRVLATVLFTDIVGSTQKAAKLGDHDWGQLIKRHHELVRAELERYRGHEVDTSGDGFFATFDGPARAIRCALAIREGLAKIGIDARAGLHTGETEMMAGKAGGIAVITAARVMAHAGPREVLVSSTVHDLVAGSGITFADRGLRTLKNMPGEWRLFEVTS